MDIKVIVDAFNNNDVKTLKKYLNKQELKEIPIMCAFGALEGVDEELLFQLCDWLFENGLDVNATENNGNTGLVIACMQKNKEYVDLYLKHGANVNCKASNGATPIIMALNGDINLDIVEALVKNGADLNEIIEINGEKTSTLDQACCNGDADLLLNLIKSGASIKKQKEALDSINWDDSEEDKEKQRILKEYENKLPLTDEISKEITTKLQKTIEGYCKDFIDNFKPEEGKRFATLQEKGLLINAITNGDHDALIELLEDDIDINTVYLDLQGTTILNVAYIVLQSENNPIKTLDILKEYGYKFGIANVSTGGSLLLSALQLKIDEDLVKAIIEHGSNVCVRNAWGNNTLNVFDEETQLTEDNIDEIADSFYEDFDEDFEALKEIDKEEFKNNHLEKMLKNKNYGSKHNLKQMLIDRGAKQIVEDKYFYELDKYLEEMKDKYIMNSISYAALFIKNVNIIISDFLRQVER